MVRLLFITFFLTFNAQAQDMVNLAIAQYQQGKKSEAIHILEQVPPHSSQFKRALEGLIKIHYNDGSLSQVFGLATFYRANFKDEEDFSLEILSLEVLALAQRCQYEMAQGLLKSVEKRFEDNPLFERLRERYQITEEYGLKEVHLSHSPTDEKKKTKERWRLTKDEFHHLESPYRLEVEVKNKCKS